MLLCCSIIAASPRQPVALEYTGTFELQDIYGLSGSDVNIASVCRSITYVDGEPQNDYLWNLEHDCFLDGNIKISDGLGDISNHATSSGGILVAEENSTPI